MERENCRAILEMFPWHWWPHPGPCALLKSNTIIPNIWNSTCSVQCHTEGLQWLRTSKRTQLWIPNFIAPKFYGKMLSTIKQDLMNVVLMNMERWLDDKTNQQRDNWKKKKRQEWGKVVFDDRQECKYRTQAPGRVENNLDTTEGTVRRNSRKLRMPWYVF